MNDEPTYRWQKHTDTLIVEDGKDRPHPLEAYLFEQVAWPFLDLGYLDMKRQEAETITETLVKIALAPKARLYLDRHMVGGEQEFCDAMVAECRKIQPALNNMQREILGSLPGLFAERIKKELPHAA